MDVKLVWPNCRLFQEEDGKQLLDAFWVECTLEEVEDCILPVLENNPKKGQQVGPNHCMKKSRILEKSNLIYVNPLNEKYCFLISRDSNFIKLMPYNYPYSHHWDDYSPFVDLDDIEINSLSDLKSMCCSKK